MRLLLQLVLCALTISIQTGITKVHLNPEEQDPQGFHGKIKINGIFYETVCSCAPEETSSEPCIAPVKMRVKQEKFNHLRGLDKESLYTLLSNKEARRLIPLDFASFSCVEGRSHKHILGTPGGDFGEFVSALSEYESATNQLLSQEDVSELLVKYLEFLHTNKGEAFYMHTDEDAVKHLETHLHVGGTTNRVLGLSLTSPPPEHHVELLRDLVKPQNNGCYYIKALLQQPQRFYTRLELVEALLRAYYRLLWDKQTKTKDKKQFLYQYLNLDVLEGIPHERAWINIRGSSSCESAHMAPAFHPSASANRSSSESTPTSVFVNHPIAVQVLRVQLAKFFALQGANIGEEDLLARFNHRGVTNMLEAAQMMGELTPYYTVVVE